jgi:N6-L-threonylcarbamoyladenine synthase
METSFKNIQILFPELSYCTDNAAMISYLGELKFQNGETGSLNFGVNPNLKLG